MLMFPGMLEKESEEKNSISNIIYYLLKNSITDVSDSVIYGNGR